MPAFKPGAPGLGAGVPVCRLRYFVFQFFFNEQHCECIFVAPLCAKWLLRLFPLNLIALLYLTKRRYKKSPQRPILEHPESFCFTQGEETKFHVRTRQWDTSVCLTDERLLEFNLLLSRYVSSFALLLSSPNVRQQYNMASFSFESAIVESDCTLLCRPSLQSSAEKMSLWLNSSFNFPSL